MSKSTGHMTQDDFSKAVADVVEERPDLAGIVAFFTDAETADLGARQLALLKRVVRVCEAGGFTLRELPVVDELLDCVHERVVDGRNADCEQTLCKMVRLCGLPGVREKSSEEVLEPGLSAAENILRRLESLLHSPNTRIAVEAARALRMAASGGEGVSNRRRELTRSLLLKAEVIPGAVAELRKRVDAMLENDGRVEEAPASALADDSDDEEAGPSTVVLEAEPGASKPTMLISPTRTIEHGESLLILGIVKLLRELSSCSAEASRILVRCGGMAAATSVLRLYLDNPFGSEAVGVTVEVLWNALEHSAAAVSPPTREDNAMWHLAEDEPLTVLRQLLAVLFARGRRAADKELRNEVLIVTSLVASHKKSSEPFRRTQLLQLVLAYAVAAESPHEMSMTTGLLTDGLADRRNFATGSSQDLEMKRILWALLSDLGRKDQQNLELIVEADFLGALLAYLQAGIPVLDEQSPRMLPVALKRLPMAQVQVLQQQAMAVLLNLAPRAPEQFQALNGHILALRFLDACDPNFEEEQDLILTTDLYETTMMLPHHHQKKKKKKADTNNNLVQGALMLLISVVGMLPGGLIQDELGALDAVRIMLRRFDDLGAADSLRTDAVQILSKLCEGGHEDNQARFRRLGGVQSLVGELERYCSGREAPVGSSPSNSTEKVAPMIVGVMDCAWNAVVGNKRCEARLPGAKGIDALLAILEVGPKLTRHQTCGLLADLSRNNAKLVPYIVAWRSDRTMRSAAQVLAHAWADEERRLGCERGPTGVLCNLQQPLRPILPPKKEQEIIISMEAPAPAPSSSMLLEAKPKKHTTDEDSSDDSSDDEQEASLVAMLLSTTSTKFERKSHGGHLQSSTSARVERETRQAVAAKDLRGKIAPILRAMGEFSQGETSLLSAEERATLCMISQYEAFRDGEAWSTVREALREAKVRPIAADRRLLEVEIGKCLEAAEATKSEQQRLCAEKERAEIAGEEAFLGTILLQRDQETRQLAIKRSAKIPKSLQTKRRNAANNLAAKTKQLQLLEADSAVEGADPATINNNNNNNIIIQDSCPTLGTDTTTDSPGGLSLSEYQ